MSSITIELFILLLYIFIAWITCQKNDFELLNSIETISQNQRLPNETRPISYDLHLKTNFDSEDSRYSGSVLIIIEAVSDTERIVLHAKDLQNINVIVINMQTGQQFLNVETELDEFSDFLIISSTSEAFQLTQDVRYLLVITFVGFHNDDIFGFHKSTYRNDDDEIYVVASQLKPTMARKMFPCYDEPGFKAIFNISVTHSSHYHAISNMPVRVVETSSRSQTNNDTENVMYTTRFKQTPPLSTFNLGVVVTNYFSTTYIRNQVKHSVFYPNNSKHAGYESVLESAVLLDVLKNYLGTDYPIEKIDHLSIKKQFGRAMGHFGLIVYQYGYVLPFSRHSKLFNLETLLVISHGLANQWFGSLVSPKWWTWTWLNEGLSTYYSYKIVDLNYPHLKCKDHIYTEYMSLDRLASLENEPLSRYVESPNEIKHKFEGHLSSKAAYIIQMFEYALTETTFRKGVKKYLDKFKYSTADEDDFLNCLQEAATEDQVPHFEEPPMLAATFKSWTSQAGTPLVTVTRDYESGVVTLEQKVSQVHHNPRSLWYIPITYTTQSGADFTNARTDLIFPNVSTITISPKSTNINISPNEWIILNKNQMAPYRVNYDDRNWGLIIETLKNSPKVISSFNRAQLLSDASFLFEEKLLPIETFFSLLSYLEKEDEVVPSYIALKILNSLLFSQENPISGFLFKNFAKSIVRHMYKKFGPETNPGDSPAVENFRPILFRFMCRIGMEECEPTSRKLLKEFINGRKMLDFQSLANFVCEVDRDALSSEDIEKFLKRLDSMKVKDEILKSRMTDLKSALYCLYDIMKPEDKNAPAINEFIDFY